MQSVRSRIFIWLIRNRHLLQMRLKPEVVDESFSVTKFREGVDKVTAKMKMPKGVKRESTSVGDISAEWLVPEQPVAGKALMYIHGGGFISGSCQTHRTYVGKFAVASGLKSLVFDYRLAPEHPFPAAVEDCVATYRWLLDQGYDAKDIVVGGESVGGTLTLSLLLALKEHGTPFPKAAFSISPVTDLRCEAASFEYNAKRDTAPEGSWDVWMSNYIADNDPTTPLLSPLMGDFTGLPPLHVCVGTHEIHLDDCVNVAKKAEQHGVDVTLSKWSGMVHAFPMMSPLFPEAKRALEEICDFVTIRLEQ